MLTGTRHSAVGARQATARYTSELSLNPSNPIDILVKRSRAQASKGLWEDALTDANEVCALCRNRQWFTNSSFLYAGDQAGSVIASDIRKEVYGEANNALIRMPSLIENAPDEELRRTYLQ